MHLEPDQLPEGMRELETLLEKKDLVVCAPLLLVHAHKKCKIVGEFKHLWYRSVALKAKQIGLRLWS